MPAMPSVEISSSLVMYTHIHPDTESLFDALHHESREIRLIIHAPCHDAQPRRM